MEFFPYQTRKILRMDVTNAQLQNCAEHLRKQFTSEGYSVFVSSLENDVIRVLIAKEGFLRRIAGLQAGLKVDMMRESHYVHIGAGVGANGQHLLPAIALGLLFPPAVIIPLWGMIQQSQLDELAITRICEFLGCWETVDGLNGSLDLDVQPPPVGEEEKAPKTI